MSKRRNNLPDGRAAEQYMVLPYSMVQHLAWRSLTGPAIKIWIELRSRFNGGNNGTLHLSMGEGAKLLHLSKSTVQRAFKELEAKGFIELITPGNWYGRKASEWAVTDQRLADQPPKCTWKSWRPGAATAEKAS